MIKLDEIETGALQAADMEGSSQVTLDSDELIKYVNNAIDEVYLAYISVFNDAYLQSYQFTISSGNTALPPPGFLKARGVDVLVGTRFKPTDTFNFRNRGQYRGGRFAHRVDSVIRIEPQETAAGHTFLLWYYPTAPHLALPDDQLDPSLEPYVEAIKLGAAIACLTKEQTDPTLLQIQKQAILDAMKKDAMSRLEPESTPDVYADNEWGSNCDPWPWVS